MKILNYPNQKVHYVYIIKEMFRFHHMMSLHNLSSFSHSLVTILPSSAHSYCESVTAKPHDFTETYILPSFLHPSNLVFRAHVLACHILCLISCGRSHHRTTRCAKRAQQGPVKLHSLNLCFHWKVGVVGTTPACVRNTKTMRFAVF